LADFKEDPRQETPAAIPSKKTKEVAQRMDLQKDYDHENAPPGGAGRPERHRIPPRPRLEGTEAASAEMGKEEYEQLLNLYDVSFKNLAEGEVVKGRVLRILPNEVVVDVGYKSEGLIDIEEFTDSTGRLRVEVGDTIDVLLEKTENQEGYVVLSKEKAEKMKVWSGPTTRGRSSAAWSGSGSREAWRWTSGSGRSFPAPWWICAR
jgi:hypothetical protein